MINIFKSTKTKKNIAARTFVAIKELYPLAYNQFREYFERINPGKCTLFLSLLTKDTFSTEYAGVFSHFFIMHGMAEDFNDYETTLKRFHQLNERLLALKN